MDRFDAGKLRELARVHRGPCISLYMPTFVSGEEGQQDRLRLRNLLDQVEAQLTDGWLRPTEARRLLQAARHLPSDSGYWKKRSHGLAVFVAPELFQHYRLPSPFEELATVNRRFHLKPLLPIAAGGGRFLLLTLSQNHVQLFTCDRYRIEPIDVPNLPQNMEQALNYTDADRGSQVHAAMKGDLGKQAAVFHGQGGQPDRHKDDLEQFFRMVDAALRPVLRDERSPLLLAAVEYLLPIYRSVSHYRNVVEDQLAGNCDYLAPHQIHERASTVMEPVLAQAQQEAFARYQSLADTAKSSTDLQEVVTAAQQGRVDVLFIDRTAYQWGLFDEASGHAELHETRQADDEDLVDLAAIYALLGRATVYAVARQEMPVGAVVAAVLRY